MEQIIIDTARTNQRFDKFLGKYLPNTTKSFLYKMIRKKNILLNGKKATGSEILQCNDEVLLYFSEDTLKKFKETETQIHASVTEYMNAYNLLHNKIDIIYEDEHVLLLQKPGGILSQKSTVTDVSINEYAIGYLLSSKQITTSDLQTVTPSICNRLDRNTSGLIIFGKTLHGLQLLNQAIKDRTIQKFYRTIVIGNFSNVLDVVGYLWKDTEKNKVYIFDDFVEGSSFIETHFKPIHICGGLSLLEVELCTGKTHQIRAHLASLGFPVLGDYKYGNTKINNEYKYKYGIETQLLHSYRIVFNEMSQELSNLSEQEFIAEMPLLYEKLLVK